MDSVQLQFDDCHLTAFTRQRVQVAGRIGNARKAGWRDSLCSRIGAAVGPFDLHAENELGITFEADSRLTVSVKPAGYTGPEAFILSVPNRPLIVS